jgi:hypothetical protein
MCVCVVYVLFGGQDKHDVVLVLFSAEKGIFTFISIVSSSYGTHHADGKKDEDEIARRIHQRREEHLHQVPLFFQLLPRLVWGKKKAVKDSHLWLSLYRFIINF